MIHTTHQTQYNEYKYVNRGCNFTQRPIIITFVVLIQISDKLDELHTVPFVPRTIIVYYHFACGSYLS